MDILQKIYANQISSTEEKRRMAIPGAVRDNFEVYEIPLDDLYYNDQNGRINTAYKKYKSENEVLVPERGESRYNEIFENFIYESNRAALNKTKESIKLKGQQEVGVVLPDGRIIDGNRRFTALRRLQREDGITKTFKAIVLKLDVNSKTDEKIIKTLELDLQMGREEKISYDPIDRIFDVYNTIEVEKLMTAQEYRDASGAGNTKGINKDIRLAELIIRFIEIVSPGGNPVDKFYLARDLKLDGPMQEIEATLNNLKHPQKEAIIDSTLVYIAISKTNLVKQEPVKMIRDLKNNVINKPDILEYFLKAVDEKTDDVIDSFEDNPIVTSSDLNYQLETNENLNESIVKFEESTRRLVYKGGKDTKRTLGLVELEDVRDKLSEISHEDFKELTSDEYIEVGEVIKDITDCIYRLRKGL